MDVLSYVAAKRINEYQRVRVISIKDIARQHANGCIPSVKRLSHYTVKYSTKSLNFEPNMA